ncbi:MAG: hypothetical protein H7Z15_08365 [Rhizobacter sp.]|nr:hypothetical protein [Rhizobacter sp.]
MATISNPKRQRIAMLIVAVGGALLVARVFALAGDDAEIAGPVQAKPARSSPAREAAVVAAGAASSVRLDRLQAHEARQQAVPASRPAASQPVLFDTVSWQPPPPKLVAAAPPKPVTPPFPYAYMGGLSEDGVRTSFFTKGERVLPVKAGDTIDAVYRVDEMTDKQMTLTYLPLNETLVVALGGGS